MHAVAKHGQEQEKKVFYERAIQNLEQQLQEFQRHLQEASAMEHGLDPISDRFEDDESVDLEENRDDQIVAEYVRRCKCAFHADSFAEKLSCHALATSKS